MSLYGVSARLSNYVRSYVDPAVNPSTVASVDFSGQGSVSKGLGFPDWRIRIQRGESATSTLSGQRYTLRALQDGHLRVRHTATVSNEDQWYEWHFIGELGLFDQFLDDPSSILIPSVKNGVIQSIVQQVREAETSLRGLVSAGEAGQTLRMINSRSRSLNRGLFSYLDTLRKRVRKTSRRGIQKAVADTWLEYSYGWRPLVNDIDDGAKALSHITTYRMPRIFVSATSSSSANRTSDDFGFTRNFGPISYSVKVNHRDTYGFKIYGSVSATPQGSPNFALTEFGITLNEFVPTLWELIPYSFLVDYFLNVGSIIDAYALNTAGVRWLNSGEFQANELIVTPEKPQFQSPAVGTKESQKLQTTGSPFYKSRERVSRSTFSVQSLVPSLGFRIPGTSTKWLNIAALASSHNLTSRLIRGLLNR